MTTPRTVRHIFHSSPVMEGAGVRLNRAFGFAEAPMFDPFLLLDDIRSDRPRDYRAGFPWHPHRGIETITYVLQGSVEHADSMGNRGVISPGAVQWMTAGSGIVHQEMPAGDRAGAVAGFQLWANLPASEKMCMPRYRDISAAELPTLRLENGVEIRVICGRVGDTVGPVKDIAIDPTYLDVSLPAETYWTHPQRGTDRAFAYVIEGSGAFGEEEKQLHENGTLLLFSNGDSLSVKTERDPLRFLLISGKPLNEQVAWQGPIVMNTNEELRTAFEEYRNGTFLKHAE